MEPKIAIVDSNYNKSKYRGLAASWLKWELNKYGIEESEPGKADILLLTVSSQQGIKALKREINRTKNKKAIKILGGGGAWAPAVFENVADIICVGEGKQFIKTLLKDGVEAAAKSENAWIKGERRKVVPSNEFPYDLPPIMHPDGLVRIFGSRGCKSKCLFCQTGWERNYTTNPYQTKLQRVADSLSRKKIKFSLVTNDGAQEKTIIKGQSQFLSMRLSNLRKIMPITKKMTRSVRIGVEGISERLRLAVGKPIKNKDLYDTTIKLLNEGIGARWFFIPGLPNETKSDWDELKDLIQMIGKIKKGVVMMNFHAFIPQPATPLSVLPVNDGYWDLFDEMRTWFFHGKGFTTRCQIVSPAQHKGRMSRACESMAASESEIREGWFEKDNPNWRVKYLATPEKLRKIAKKYDEKTKKT